MNLRFKTRIALFNTVAGAAVTFLVFLAVYAVVYVTAYNHLDDEIRQERDEVFADITWKGDSVILNMMSEKLEAEHRQAEVSPTFLQVVDSAGRLLFRSENLVNDHLLYADAVTEPIMFNIDINGKLIRQGQFPIINDRGKLLGQVDIGLPQAELTLILANLRLTLGIAFPLMLFVFFFASYWAASRGIKPVNNLIRVAGMIGDSNISTRLPLPSRKDEIHQLATTINALLGRIELSLNREKQITADISHELRTPLTIIRGTLEVLVRKTREPMQYEEKILQVIREVDALNRIVDRLLQLSRLDAGTLPLTKTAVRPDQLIKAINERWLPALAERNIELKTDIPADSVVQADRGFLEIMLENLLSNAIKYNRNGSSVVCTWSAEEKSLSISDNGPGIPQDQIPFLFDRFYRSDASRSSQVDGNGLGLSIVKTLADLQGIVITVSSQVDIGTIFTLRFQS